MNVHSALSSLLAVALSAALAASPVMAQLGSNLPDLGDPSQAALSPALERKIGEAALRDFRINDPAFVHDVEVEEYLNRLGNKLVSVTSLRDQSFRFFALREKSINAFAMPGGFIGVHTGLILASQTESELASVLAHEIGHVEQRHIARMLSNQGMATATVLASLLIAVLAARSNAQAAEGALLGGQALAIDQQLSFSRDFEREADRVGFQTLESAGFDVRGMAAFFERLQQANRLNEVNAPTYLRTHPLTGDRISDIQGRAQNSLRKQPIDSLEFTLVRAKLDADIGTPGEASARVLARGTGQGQEQVANLYELTRIQLRERKLSEAAASLEKLRALGRQSSMIEYLAADLAIAQRRFEDAVRLCHDGQAHNPGIRSLVLCEAESWLAAGKPEQALAVVEPRLVLNRQDLDFFTIQARAYAALGKTFQQQRAQAEVYYLQGSLGAAVEQLRLAQLSGGGDYFEQTAVDARLRELRNKLREEMLERKQQGGSARLSP